MPLSIDAEFRANFVKFRGAVAAQTSSVHTALAAHDSQYLESYKFLCAFRGWHEIALLRVDEGVAGFFIEAHNDLLTAHLLAENGMWRPSLIALRAFMENYLSFIYFKDHPIEFRLWSAEKFRLEPKDARAYCVMHPDISRFGISCAAAVGLGASYSKLSGSVHATKTDFRMTAPSAYPAISIGDGVKLRKWLTQERIIVRSGLVILLALYASRMRGAAFPVFRRVLGSCLTVSTKAAIRQQIGVNL